jgi:hypothetical protein
MTKTFERAMGRTLSNQLRPLLNGHADRIWIMARGMSSPETLKLLVYDRTGVSLPHSGFTQSPPSVCMLFAIDKGFASSEMNKIRR